LPEPRTANLGENNENPKSKVIIPGALSTPHHAILSFFHKKERGRFDFGVYFFLSDSTATTRMSTIRTAETA
jgi:hypothetical protein